MRSVFLSNISSGGSRNSAKVGEIGQMFLRVEWDWSNILQKLARLDRTVQGIGRIVPAFHREWVELDKLFWRVRGIGQMCCRSRQDWRKSFWELVGFVKTFCRSGWVGQTFYSSRAV